MSIIAVALVASARAQVAITVNAATTVRTVDERVFGLNTAVWDGAFIDTLTLPALQESGVRFLRYPGGSDSDTYHWQTNTAWDSNSESWVNGGSGTFDFFAQDALTIGAQVIMTTNYVSGTAQEAAAWVQYSNVTKGYGFKYWEVGNECYGNWEYPSSLTALTPDPQAYATAAVQFIQAMKAVDPTIKVGVVGDAGEDSYPDSNESAVNPVTNLSHHGWTPVMLAKMRSLGVLPDFLIFHHYAQNPPAENDATLLQDSLNWPSYAQELRYLLTAYLGTEGAGVELLCTENNSASYSPGKQTTSLVNALYMADSMGSLMQTEFNSLVWWDLHNGPGAGDSSNPVNLSSSLYGWRMYGDYGLENTDTTSVGTINIPPHDRYPTFYIEKLLTHFARGGDKVVAALSSSGLLTPYAVKRQDGTLSLLVINKSPTASYTANISVNGFAPKPDATVYSYGIPQDENSEENAPGPVEPATGFSWENSMEGWVNQSGYPDDATTSFGLSGPFLYSTSFSQTTGVTLGSYSLDCTTTAANPGYSALIQNSTTPFKLGLSQASSVSVDIDPVAAAGTTVQVGLYLNGSSIPYVVLGTFTLNVNQENTVTFPLSDSQRSGITGSADWFQAGITISSTAPVSVYFDHFVLTPLTAPTPTPVPTPIPGAASSPDVAVSSISNAGTAFSATFAPYSVTLLSLAGPTAPPAAAGQPASQSIASGSTVVFTFPTTGSPAPTFQWYRNGTALSGATSATLVLSAATSANAGSYTCTATNSSGTATSDPATLAVVATSNPGRLTNLSCRAQVGTGTRIMTAGFVVGPTGLSGHQSVLVRGSGPALGVFSLTGLLADPMLTLNNTSTGGVVDTDTGWGASPAITAAADLLGAFSWGTSATPDSALLESLPPDNYTAQIAGASGDTGLALVEVYDATPAGTYTTSMPRLTNLSALIQDGAGAQAVAAGFVIGGNTAKTVLIRASGPALAASPFGFSGALSDPQLTLTNLSVTPNQVITVNTGWGGDPQINTVANSVGAFGWSLTSADSAIVVTLPPGNYTAGVAGASGDTGLVLIELYEVP